MKRAAKKVFVGFAGGIVVILGIIMVFTPGPALLVIPAGIGILATEFEWAQRLKERFRERFDHWREAHRKRKAARKATSAAID